MLTSHRQTQGTAEMGFYKQTEQGEQSCALVVFTRPEHTHIRMSSLGSPWGWLVSLALSTNTPRVAMVILASVNTGFTASTPWPTSPTSGAAP